MGIESELGRKVDSAHFAGEHRQAERSGKKPAGSTQRILDVGEHDTFDSSLLFVNWPILGFVPKKILGY